MLNTLTKNFLKLNPLNIIPVLFQKNTFYQGQWTKEQTPHGGQDWMHLDNYIEDFSLTTNCLRTPEKAIEASIKAIKYSEHYPPADMEPAKTSLAQFMFPKKDEWQEPHSRLLMGNGASEIIDLIVKDSKINGILGLKTADYQTQYKEYERSAKSTGHKIHKPSSRSAGMLSIINPCNPTGSYMNVFEIKDYIEKNTQYGNVVLVDESMQSWLGPHWREDSLIYQRDWVKKMLEERNVVIWLIHSWTKIWRCCGLRIGSVLAPSLEHKQSILSKQVPWSVNTPGLYFLNEVVKDKEFMEKTWELTPKWRKRTKNKLQKMFPHWKIHGEEFISWLWIDTGSEQETKEAVDLCLKAGTPVRPGEPGYNLPTFFRIAVRSPKLTDHLLEGLRPLMKNSKK